MEESFRITMAAIKDSGIMDAVEFLVARANQEESGNGEFKDREKGKVWAGAVKDVAAQIERHLRGLIVFSTLSEGE